MNTSTHLQFMQKAIELAKSNVHNMKGGPFGAVVVKDAQIVGQAANTVITANDPTAHAEINAIRDACYNLNTFQLNDCVIYTSCEPCPMCMGAIYWARIKTVYYAATKDDAALSGFDDSFIYKQIEIPHEQRSIPFRQILPEKAKEAFVVWDENQNKIPY